MYAGTFEAISLLTDMRIRHNQKHNGHLLINSLFLSQLLCFLSTVHTNSRLLLNSPLRLATKEPSTFATQSNDGALLYFRGLTLRLLLLKTSRVRNPSKSLPLHPAQ